MASLAISQYEETGAPPSFAIEAPASSPLTRPSTTTALISKATGEVCHDQSCTWCKFRINVPSKAKRPGFEMCALTARRIPGPTEPGRYCEHYTSPTCDCEQCVSNGTLTHQTV